MLISVAELSKFWNVHPKGVIHVGAHEAEESEQYQAANWGQVFWIDAQPDKVKLLENKFAGTDHKVINAAVWSVSGIPLELQVMTNSASSSLFDLGTHKDAHPDVKYSHSIQVKTQVLEELIPQNTTADYLCLDIQGAELEAIKGFGPRIETMNWIYTEINRDELYKGCCLVEELDNFLKQYGFTRMATRWTEFGWGDALYIHQREKVKLNLAITLIWRLTNILYYVKRNIKIFLKKSLFFVPAKKSNATSS